jgi:hypothetical protein
MLSYISNSDRRFLAVFAVVFLLLAGAWDFVVRKYAGVPIVAESGPAVPASGQNGPHTWLVFGNCLVLNGVSTGMLAAEINSDTRILNLSRHEQSPLAYFHYLRKGNYYPPVIVTNVSSWLNSTNFSQEGELLARADPLGLFRRDDAGKADPVWTEDVSTISEPENDNRRAVIESRLSSTLASGFPSLGKRYHLFDYTGFLWQLIRTRDLDAALYQIGLQSWFQVIGSEVDGSGHLGIKVRYTPAWERNLDVMAEKQLQRMRVAKFLDEEYWRQLEEHLRHFRINGTRVFLVRMPEHPSIRAFNDETYNVPAHLANLSVRTDTPTLDLSDLGLSDGIRLFDAVHPDAEGSRIITQRIAAWLHPQVNPSTTRF